jgi:hypothetical protein
MLSRTSEKVDAGWGELGGRGVGGEGVEAVADVVAEEGDVEGGEVGWVGLEFAEGGGEEAGGAEGVRALEVVEGDGDLYEGLQEELFGFGRGEPDALPVFVGGEVFSGVVVVEAFGEGAVRPVKGHGRSLAEAEQIGGRQKRITENTEQKREHRGS